ncbi:putative disease resistance protein RGA3 [Bienertia sinuspersici]
MDSSSDTYPSKIEGINNRLEEILTRVGPLNLMRQTLSSEEQQEDRADTSSLARVVYGRDDEKQKIIQRLLSEDEEACSENYGNYTVVPIVGQGGIGKTTLAQSVYNDEQVKAHYDVKAWVCVSDVFDVKQITTAIISSATNKTHNFSDLNQAQEKLKRLLNQKRFLFVLDDIWSDEYNPWEQLQLPFQAGSKGSRVLITTRLKGVANNMLTTPDENPIMYLQVLSDDECWLIFKQHALISDDPIEVRSQVIRLSKGLPLAAKALGFLPESEWESMENKGHSYFDDLVSRSLFEPISFPKGCFMMHDLIHDLAQWAAGDVCSRDVFDMQTLTELRHLDISGASMLDAEEMPTSEDAEKARLSEKSHLELLEMHWQDEGLEITTEVVNQLQPPESLQELKLYGYIGLAFPTWLGNSSFNKMVVTRLSGCSRCKHLPPLGQLPSLKKLVVEHMSGITTVGLELYGAGCLSPFPSLKILNFENMENWEKWLTLTPNNNNNRAFPCLEELKISSCPMLQGDIPPYLPLLKRLKIKECNVMKVSLPSSHMLQTLNIYKCQELRSIEPVICCSKRMILSNIASFCGVEGIWVPDLGVLLVGNKDPVETDVPTFSGNLIALVACPKLLSWQPDVYGDLNRLTYVGLNNCATMAAFMERKFPSSVKHLSNEGYDSIRHVSTLTKGSTCLEKLYIQNCSSLITVNNLPLTLQVLCIQDVEIEQPAKAWELHLLTSLKLLKIMNAGSCVDSVESISSDSDGLHLPSSLIKINIIGFKFLKFMSCSTFPKLTNLWIQNCPLMTIECIHNSYGFSFRGKDARGDDIYTVINISCCLATKVC